MKTSAFVAVASMGLWALLAPLLAPAAAQTGAEDPVAACRAAHGSDATARIACLESAIQRMRGQVAQAEQQAAAAQARAAEAQQQAEAQRSRPSWSIPGFRAAQENAEPTSVRVELTRIRYGRDGFGIFTTADGQVWRETVSAPRRRHLDPEQTYQAEIRRTVLGYRMLVDGIRWEYKVEPLN